MNKYYCLFFVLALLACNKKNESGENGSDSATEISEVRKAVKPEAVSSYTEPVKDKDGLNDWKFAVSLFETDQTFKYKIKVKYKELEAEDDLVIPNFGIEPKVEVQKGKEPLTCVIGFMDKENVFKELKRVEIIGDELKIRQTKSYSMR